ncbi:hypothetical protein [Salinicola sp. MIT1003]|uniref:hypothetical protein n=1 Tax=Salinicola sp. MIT1003 TaxID=1882734 RepID=UPI0008DCE908|nr:hypothetical protein [Salinicola sp. MIT1003]OHZ01888.1 hypothetical protein BC443_02435 [Salinicola sp. MIT1003]
MMRHFADTLRDKGYQVHTADPKTMATSSNLLQKAERPPYPYRNDITSQVNVLIEAHFGDRFGILDGFNGGREAGEERGERRGWRTSLRVEASHSSTRRRELNW